MRRIALLLACALLLAGCAAPAPKDANVNDRPPTVAIPEDFSDAGIQGVTLRKTADPAGAVLSGEADLALVKGPVPSGLNGLPYQWNEWVLMQGWMDPPLSLTRAEAEEALKRAGTSRQQATPRPGALLRGRLWELRPGWRAVPVDGVPPTPDTVLSGEYPLSALISVVYGEAPRPAARAVIEQYRAQTNTRPGPWIRLSVAGDFMLARGVARAMREHGTLYPIEKVRDHLASADLAFANLESPIGVKGKPLPGKQIWFRAAPEAIDILKAAGLDGVTVANNHILDYDTENFLETLETLEKAGIKYVGGGRNIAEARAPMVLEARGIKVAFLGYSQFADLFFDWNYPRSFAATDTVPGVARIQDDWLAEDIRKAKAMADVVAVTFHWGEEFQNHPTAEQRRLARLSIDLGADLVLGYHPHAIQGFELYKGKFIAYSTGNFIMDRQETDLARESMLLDFTISKEGVRSAIVHPVWIKAEQPYIMTGAEGERLLQKMRTISDWK